MTVYIKIYDGIKYEAESKVEDRITYSIDSFTVKQSRMIGEELENSGLEKDPYNEYLILNCTDGTTETYRNSYVDLMKY